MKKLFAVAGVIILVGIAYVLFFGAGEQNATIVRNSKGEYLGTITNTLIDSSGNIGLVIVSIDERIGQGKKEIAIPIQSFSYDSEKKLLLDISREELAAAPEFKISNLRNPNFAEEVYRFFGLMPAWTEEGMSGAEM